MKKIIIPIATIAVIYGAYTYGESVSENNPEPRIMKQVNQTNDNITVSSQNGESIETTEPITNALFGTYAIYNADISTGASVIGTGFLIENKGQQYLVTNQHVVEDNLQTYYIRDYEKNKYEASIIYQNPKADIAFLKINTTNKLIPLTYEETINVNYLASPVYTIGNPYDLLFSISSGVLSNFKKNVVFENGEFEGIVIQTDINVNPGNSGGPLLNKDGEVIGIIVSSLKEATGISFAIPMESVLTELQKAQ